MKNLLLKVVSVFIILITFLLLFFGLTKGVSYFVSKNASEKSKSEEYPNVFSNGVAVYTPDTKNFTAEKTETVTGKGGFELISVYDRTQSNTEPVLMAYYGPYTNEFRSSDDFTDFTDDFADSIGINGEDVRNGLNDVKESDLYYLARIVFNDSEFVGVGVKGKKYGYVLSFPAGTAPLYEADTVYYLLRQIPSASKIKDSMGAEAIADFTASAFPELNVKSAIYD